MYVQRCILVPVCLSDFKETCIFSIDFRKNSNTKFQENPSSGSRGVPRARIDRQTEITRLIVAFRNFFLKRPKNGLQPLNDKVTYKNKWTLWVNFVLVHLILSDAILRLLYVHQNSSYL